MNTACLGLGMLLAQATQRSTHPTHPVQPSPEELERLEILADINASCTTAVEILNDLLTFEVRVRRQTALAYSIPRTVHYDITLRCRLCTEHSIALCYTASHHTLI